jgi:transcriptional regulator with XRE-family HTH domain
MLKELRTDSCMTQADVAHELHVDRSAVAKWESGKARPSIDLLMPIARLYRVSIERLLEVLCGEVSA